MAQDARGFPRACRRPPAAGRSPRRQARPQRRTDNSARRQQAASKRSTRQFRGKDKPTNVLSFRRRRTTGIILAISRIAYGATPTAKRARRENFPGHATHLVVHGVLHLLGYDHETVRDACAMEPLETAILGEFGIADPYAPRRAKARVAAAGMSDYAPVRTLTATTGRRRCFKRFVQISPRRRPGDRHPRKPGSGRSRRATGSRLRCRRPSGRCSPIFCASAGSPSRRDGARARRSSRSRSRRASPTSSSVFREAQHSRLPVYRETLDDPIGLIHIKDMIGLVDAGPDGRFRWRGVPLATITRQLLFVPPSMPLLDLLLKMQTDSYPPGARDRRIWRHRRPGFDRGCDRGDRRRHRRRARAKSRRNVRKGEDGSLRRRCADGSQGFRAHTGIALATEDTAEDIDTVGGLVVSLLGRVPQRGEIIDHPGGFEFEVLEADPRRVKRVRLRRSARGMAQDAPA